MNCKDCKYFERMNFLNPNDSTTSQLGGKCKLLLEMLKIDNSSLVWQDYFYVQDTFGCVLFKENYA